MGDWETDGEEGSGAGPEPPVAGVSNGEEGGGLAEGPELAEGEGVGVGADCFGDFGTGLS